MPQDNRGYSTGVGSGVDFNIGALPGMSANARNVLEQVMSQPSDNWGSAVSRLGAAFALGHADKKARTAKQKKKVATQERRQSWAEQLGAGMSARDLAVSDHAFLGDTEFQKQWAATAPAPEAATWDDVQNPYGAGGFGQRNSVTGQIGGYNRPVAPTAKPQRRIVEGADKRKYYADTQELVLPGVEAPLPETPTADFKHVRALAGDWENATKPVRALGRQRDLMEIGLEAARAGDMAAGSQAVLVTFQKILDPT